MSLAKLRKYITAYNLKTERVVEKDDLIDAIISARVRCFVVTSLIHPHSIF